MFFVCLQDQMEKMQGMFMKELKEMHEKYSSSQIALEDLQTKYGKLLLSPYGVVYSYTRARSIYN